MPSKMLLVWFASLALTSVASAQTEFRNDGFEDSDSAAFQSGFVATEIGASRFLAAADGIKVDKVHFLFGGDTKEATITLHVWDDSAQTNAPGAELFSGEFTVTGSNEAIQEIDLTAENVVVPRAFRVGIEFQHDGLPSIARDDDDTIAASRNFIMAAGAGWVASSTLGLTGDWILRVDVGGLAAADAGPSDSSPDAGIAPLDCAGNADCPEGRYCDSALDVCTFDCRTADDCSSGSHCNTLGQCVDGGDGGCGVGSSVPGFGALAGFLLGIAAIMRRRRA